MVVINAEIRFVNSESELPNPEVVDKKKAALDLIKSTIEIFGPQTPFMMNSPFSYTLDKKWETLPDQLIKYGPQLGEDGFGLACKTNKMLGTEVFDTFPIYLTYSGVDEVIDQPIHITYAYD